MPYWFSTSNAFVNMSPLAKPKEGGSEEDAN